MFSHLMVLFFVFFYGLSRSFVLEVGLDYFQFSYVFLNLVVSVTN